jgi:hypothetical protein
MVAIRYIKRTDGTKMGWIIKGNPGMVSVIMGRMSDEEMKVFESFFEF